MRGNTSGETHFTVQVVSKQFEGKVRSVTTLIVILQRLTMYRTR